MDSRYLQLTSALDGYQRSHVPLVAYDRGRYIPAGLTDDTGMYLFVPMMSSAFHLSVASSIDLFLGTMISIGFALGAIGLVFQARTNISRALGLILITCIAAVTLIEADVYAAQSSFVVAVIPWVIHLERVCRLKRSAWVFAFLLGLSGSVMNSIRMHSGTAVLLFAAVVVLGTRRCCEKKWSLVAATALGFVLGLGAFTLAIHNRDVYLRANDPTYRPPIAHHPLWHNIYAGLGFLQNDYGMKYDDSVSAAKVTSIDPRAEYLSPEYERILRTAVFEFILAHPKFVAGTVIVKLGVLLFALIACANVGLIAAVKFPKPWPVEAAFLVCLGFTGLASILAVPRPSYMLGYLAFAMLYGVTSIDYASAFKTVAICGG